MSTLLESLRQHTIVVADTGNFETIREFRPTDATTNPSLILKAVQQSEYQHLLERVVKDHPNASVSETSDLLLVAFGTEILRIVPGRVSTEVDARLSFDTAASIERARQIVDLYEKHGIERERILIKLAASWEGIQAAKALQTEGINCNLTLLFSLTQAIACAQAKVKLISPFVGRIYDWYKKSAGQQWVETEHVGPQDPGVQSVRSIYNYYKTYDINTEIMGASFRNIEQILALAGCDLLTISPDLLSKLAHTNGHVDASLSIQQAKSIAPEWRASNEVTFRTDLNADAMASEKLGEGIRLFTADALKLDALIQAARQAN
ncbi:transaldolase [Alcaligenes endophyticus]|uniref:Transaldolase n=1 Tax=Alcaligenes endophyticus TaxID=1929088 RepID=A0ABT8EMZ5_9BURK|nr:transaldolase [Alcaligenes endophyticus]MCX5591496.1 transaldolase [Alcaligenes endophyticus]MDN4122623.1 transaldolase [Alcaligenes endophyticus]